MRTTRFLALALAAATCPVPVCLAAPAATQDQADSLRTMFERYLGHPAAGEPGSVTVVPEGQAYRTSIDVKQLMRPLENMGMGMTVEPATQSLLLTPNDNGTWHVTGDVMPPLVMHLKDQTITMKTSTYAFDGTFDPKLGIFLNQTSTQDGSTLDQEAPAMSQHRRSGRAVLTEKAVPAANATADLDVHYGLTDITAQMSMRPPPPKDDTAEATPAPPPFDLSYTVPTSAVDVHIDRLPALKLLDLWAFLVAHPNRDAITGAQEELRGLLRAALPLMGGLKESGSAEGLVVKTQMGDVSAHHIAAAVELADPAGTGRMISAFSVDGLVLPALPIPSWSAGFLPSAVDLRPTVTGLHIDEGIKEAVDSFDLAADGFKPEQGQKIGHIFWPGDGKVVLAPSRIVSPLLDVKFDGEATIGPAPTGRVSIVATGLDKAIATVQAAAGTDPSAAQFLTMLVTAKNLAKPDADGALAWVIEAAADHAVTVNGVPMK